MKKFLIMAALAVAVSLPAYAQIQTVNIWASGDSTPDAVTLNYMGVDASGNALYGFDYSGTDTYVPETFTTATGTVTMKLTELVYDSDPSVRFAFGVNNPDGATGSSPYSFTFATPVTLGPGQYSVDSTISGSLVQGAADPSGNPPVVLSLPGSGGDVMQNYIGKTTDSNGRQDAGVDQINSQVSFNPTNTDFSEGFGSYNAASTANVIGSASQISVTTAFDLSNSDSASFTGRFDVNAVPEPSGLGLGLIAIGAFVGLAVRARHARS